VRDQYRAELIDRFYQLTRPPRPQRDAWQPNRGGKWGGNARFAPPRPTSAGARAIGANGIAPTASRAVVAGLLRYPEVLGGHGEAVAALPLADRDTARMRDLLLDCAMSHGNLDPERLLTILADKGAAALAEALRLEQGLGFSFNRRDVDPERATRDLVLAVETLARRPALDTALAAATGRLMETGDEAAFEEQQQLLAARDEADRNLAALIEGDAEI
jgi:DNA primase